MRRGRVEQVVLTLDASLSFSVTLHRGILRVPFTKLITEYLQLLAGRTLKSEYFMVGF